MSEKLLNQLRDAETGIETKIILTGVDFNLATRENILTLKRLGVSKIFTLFPIKQSQLENRSERGEFVASPGQKVTLEKLYAKFKIQPDFVTQLMNSGIQVSSLSRNPTSFRHYDSFDREARETKGRILIQCIHGKHASAAYAMYYLANSTPYTIPQIHSILQKAGLTVSDISRATEFLHDAGVNLKKLVENKERILHQRIKQNAAIVKSVIRNRKKRGKTGVVAAQEFFNEQARQLKFNHHKKH